MASLVIPGININEIDQTTSTPNVSSTIGAVAGIFNWGPIDKVALVSGNEDKLVKKYGKPDNNNYETFFTAANFMSYGGSHLLSEFVALGLVMSMSRHNRSTHQSDTKHEFLGAVKV